MQTTQTQLLKFLITGSIATLTDFFVYTTAIPILSYNGAKALSFLIGISIAYLLNTFWTFERKRHSHKEGLRFAALYAGIITVNVSLNHVVLSVFSNQVLAAFVLATGVSMIINFTGQKWWVFKD
ncbi:MAG: hypothetical protein RL538_575 [Candidatus Parcubacteria bacterium]|jgi:putative flippase GtrA